MKKIKIIFFALFVTCLSSCADMLDNIRPYLDKGEKIYVGKVVSLYACEGRNRIELIGYLPYGSSQSECAVEITNSNGETITKRYDIADIKDVIETEDEQGNLIAYDIVRITLNDMEEGLYGFKVQMFDKSGNSSLTTISDGYSYGSIYESTLMNRKITSLEFDAEGVLLVKWASQDKTVRTELKYTNTEGVETEIVVSPMDVQTKIADAKRKDGELTWKTIYLPAAEALDEFQSPTSKMRTPLAEFKFDKKKFQEVILPGDLLMGGWGMPMSNAWDDNIESRAHNQTDGSPLPYSLTIDLGRIASLNRYMYWQFSGDYFGRSNFEEWEIYGRADAPTDNSWEGWTLLRNCQNHKPDGFDQAKLNDLGAKGHEYDFDSSLPPVRYVRFKISKIFGGNQLFIGELTFYGLIN